VVDLGFSTVEGNVVVDNTDLVGFYRSVVGGNLILIRNREVFFQGSWVDGHLLCRHNLLVTGAPPAACAGA
jgi:hypothetical protein